MNRPSFAGMLLGLCALPIHALTAAHPYYLEPPAYSRCRGGDTAARRPLRGRGRTKRKHARRASGTIRDQRSR